jgi:hypothetical protein
MPTTLKESRKRRLVIVVAIAGVVEVVIVAIRTATTHLI